MSVVSLRAALDALRDPDRWAAAIAASAEQEESERAERAQERPSTPDGAPALDIGTIAREAAQLAPGPFGFFLWLEKRLVAAGFPAVSPWWLATLRRFYASGKRWLVVMAGRGAGKSTLLTRVAVAEALFQPRTTPPGETWVWPFVSVATADARRRIMQIQAILGAIGITVRVSYPQGHPTIDTAVRRNEKGKEEGFAFTDLRGNPIAFVAFASTIAALSGPTSIGGTVDEEAKLRGEGANPSAEVIATLLQTFRARPGIRGIRCSSAWVTAGSHYDAVNAGDTAANHVARIGADFLPAVVSGLEAVARWEEERAEGEEAERIRAHARSLTAESTNVPTWLGNPTLGNPAAVPWEGAALASRLEVEALPREALDGLTRAAFWLRENASVPVRVGAAADDALAAAAVRVAPPPARPALSDVVIGVAPPDASSPEWGLVIAGVEPGGFLVLADHTFAGTGAGAASLLALLGQGHKASVLCVAKEHAGRLRAELAAGLSGLAAWAPPVAEVDVYDGAMLRTGPLRSLLDAARLRLTPGLSRLTRAIGAHRPSTPSARVRALAAAVARLVACYPWAAATTQDGRPIVGPRMVESMLQGGGSGLEVAQRLGARIT